MGDQTDAQRANLARIRDNQRRSRARRKEYLQDLETKYRTCEAVGVEASAEIQAAARRVLDENKRSRSLLKKTGFSDAEIDGMHSPSDAFHGGTVEKPQYPSAAGESEQMLSTRRECKPGSNCEASPSSETAEPRRRSCAPAIPTQSQSQSQSQPAARPPPQSQPRLSKASAPQEHNSSAPNYSSPQSAPQSNSHTPTSAHFAPPPPAIPHYDIFAQQQYQYPILMDEMQQQQQWQNPSPVQQQSQQQWQNPSPVQQQPQQQQQQSPHQGSYDNTSSCYAAAEVIREFNHQAGPEVESASGCGGVDGRECKVDNAVVFEVMDRYVTQGMM